MARIRWLDLEDLESRTLLATIPAVAATGSAINLSNLGTVTSGGNANNPLVEIDPYNPSHVVAVWGVDLSSLSPVPHTTAIVEGAYSNNAGASWHSLGESVAPPLLDVTTVNANPPAAYTQVTSPSVAFDAQHNFYVLSMEGSGANDGALLLTKFNFSGATPGQQTLPNGGIVYQWVAGSDAATTPVLAVDASPPSGSAQPDPNVNNVYIAWASIDTQPANPSPYVATGFNPNRIELVVGSSAAGSLAFSEVKTISTGGNFGPQDNSHPQLVINQNDGGQVTVAWDDFGSGAKASPPFDELKSSLVQPGATYGFGGGTGPIAPAMSANNVTTAVTTPFTDNVTGLNPAAVNNMTVTIDLVDQQSVQNLDVTLVAPDQVHSITLFFNQNNTAGQANQGIGLPGGNAVGVFGFTPGAPPNGTPGVNVGTIFDDNATRNIFDPTTNGTNGNSAPYIGYFRAEGGSLANFLNSLGGNINGQWTLEVTNVNATLTMGVANQAFLQHFSLQFSTGMTSSAPSAIATTVVTGALGNNYARAVPSTPNGVGPGLVLAVDNTLGATSPYKGRIYAAYVDYFAFKDGNGHVNPTTNTDIELAYSDNGGVTWNLLGTVNDDNSFVDGNSASGDFNFPYAYTSGRTQFQPTLAVDQATGTLVVSWRDARNDAANARVATYLASSIDGGASFSPQTYANPPQTATDAITGQIVSMGPEADNQAGGNAQRDNAFGYGNQMGLAVFNGHVYPVWAGNLNQSFWNGTAVIADPLDVWYRPMVIAAGPRIINSTMGPIQLSTAQGRNITIFVTFDRPVTASTFVAGDVQVYYHSTSGSDSFVKLNVSGNPTPVGGPAPDGGYTEFTINFDPLPPGANPATFNYTGTYSYLIAPDFGGVSISSPIASYVGSTLRPFDPMDQNADGTSDENALTTRFFGTTPGDVYAVPTPNAAGAEWGGAVTGIPGFNTTPILYPAGGFNPNTLPIIVPGPQVVATSVPGGNASAGNLVTNGTVNTLSVTFDRPMQVSSFTPSQVAQIMGPTGSLSGPQYFPSTSSTGQIIPPATASGPSTLSSTLTIPSYNGTFSIAHISVALNAAFAPDSALTGILIAPDGTQVTLFSNVGGNGANFVNTIFDDLAETPIASGKAPFTGSFQPKNKLGAFNGHTVDMPNPAAPTLWVPGVWTLQLINAGTGATGMLDNWSLSITPTITVSPVATSETTVNNVLLATQYNIGFPRQQLSGTYTIQLGPNIVDQFGDGLDTNQNAGLQVLRGQNPAGPTITVNYGAADLPKAIPAPAGTTAGQVTSTITVPDSFIIQGDQTAAGASVIQVQIGITYPTDPDLTATLTHYDLNNDALGTVTLFSGVGNGSTTANFNNTVFDDNAKTPIQNAHAPFFGTYDPQQSLATIFAPAPDGMSVQGKWVLTITNSSTTGGTGTFTGWSLTFQKPVTNSGLAEPGSDNATASFRIFTLGQADAASSQQWTAVGPASIGGGASGNADPSGRVTGLAIDPSDPSGNTVYAAGASGGVWKTTNFLTTNSAGPTWIPLTNFGPTSAVNIGGIAVFPRNNDPNQSIVIAATGEGDTGSSGVGFLISDDGGATWNLYDSTTNVDANGNLLPINSPARDREFIGNTSFAVTVDPRPTPTGEVIIYAAMSGTHGGIWRSEDTGKTWSLMLAGQATSVVLDADSGAVLNATTGTYVQGNLQIVYAAIRGVGVYMSPNQGQVWNQMLGGIGNPLIFNSAFNGQPPNINPVNGPTPNGAQGRITLAVPASTGNAAHDAVYQGWLYALVATPGGALNGIFVTKDFGANWTEVNIPTEPNQGYLSNPAIPAGDVTLANYSVIGSAQFPQGNYNQAMVVDPTNPSVIYVGGTADGNEAALIRVNLTTIWDAHALVATSAAANDGGAISLNSTGPATIYKVQNPLGPNYLNLIRNPGSPFVSDSTINVFNYTQFTNNGAGVLWTPLDSGGTDYHRMVAMIDPTTRLPRLIFGDDQGIWSVLDNAGTPEYTIGANDALADNSRNGNLQITQFYYGAAQPSSIAAQIAGALFYGSAQDNGGPFSDPNIISNGDLVWGGPGGDASGVATDQQGNGTIYQYFWPCCGGFNTDFFQVNGTGETTGLLQASNGAPTPDPQWPYLGGANFAVNPVNGQDIVISSQVGRIFTTNNEGVNWFDVGDPAVFNNPTSFSVALAYGAPDPTAPSGIGNLGNFIYVGTNKGQIYVTQNGGGSGTSNNWINISTGLDGSPVEQIVTDPTRASHDAYAVTAGGVFFIANSIPSSNNPTPTWVNLTSNLKTLSFSIFGQSYNPTSDKQPYDQAVSLSSIVADWRYTIPIVPSDPSKGSYPVLYVGANSGVYQSQNDGQSWTLFPDTAYGALAEGGYLPHVAVSTLSVALGNIDASTGLPTLAGPFQAFVSTGTLTPGSTSVTSLSSTTGLASGENITGIGIPVGARIVSVDVANHTLTLSAPATGTGPQSLSASNPQATPDPDVLMAATFGQGEFAINLPPLVVNNVLTVGGVTPPAGIDPLPVVTGPLTISGQSEVSGNGSTTWITVEDVTDPAHPVVVAGFNPANAVPVPGTNNSTSALGSFTIPFNPETYYTTNGDKTIAVFATDDAGAVGNVVTYSFNLNPPTHLKFETTAEPPANASAGSNFASPSAVVVDVLTGANTLATNYNGPVTLALSNNTTVALLGTLTVNAVNGVATFKDLEIDTTGTYTIAASSPSLTTGLSTSITITPAAATKLVWATEPPDTSTVGEAFGATLNLEDQFNNLETGYNGNISVDLYLNGTKTDSDFDPNATTTVTAAGGVATFTNLIINTTGGPFTLVASGDGVTSSASSPINVVAAQLVVTSQPTTSITAGNSFSITVTAENSQGVVQSDFNGTVKLAVLTGPNGAIAISGSTTAIAANGVATFPAVVLDTAGGYVLQASTSTLQSGNTGTITIVGGTATGLQITTEPPANVTAGAPFGLKVGAQDQFHNPTSFTGSVSIAILSNPGPSTLGGTTLVTVSGGVATFTNLTLNIVDTGYTLKATSGTLASDTTSPIAVTPAAANQLVILASGEPPANVTAGQTFPMSVQAEDPFGNVDTNFTGAVTLSLANSSTAVFVGVPPSLTVSAVNGVAKFSSLAIDTAGSYQIAATNQSLGSVVSNTVTVTADPQAAILAWITQPPTQVVHGVGFPVVLNVEDQYGNLETTYTQSVALSLDINPGSATLGGNTSVSAVGGVATFSGISISAIGNGYTLLASSNGVNSADSDPINVTAIPPVAMSVTTQPTTPVQVAQAFGFTVTITDQSGAADPDFNGSVTVAIAGSPGGNTLSGTKTVNASNGVATFSGLTLSNVGTVTLQVSSSGLTSVNTASINVTASTASQLFFVTQPANSQTAGAPFSFKVQAEDAFGNLATTFSGTLVASLSTNSANATLGGSVTAIASGGLATFSGVSVNQVGTGFTIQVSGVNGPPATSNPFSVSIGPVAALIIPTEPPSSVTAGVPFSLTIAAADAYGNVETSYSGPITIGLLSKPGNGALNGTLTATATNGVATFSGLSLFTAAAGYTIQATSGTLTAVASSPIAVTAAATAKLAVLIPPPSTVVAGANFGLNIAAQDAYGNPTTSFTGNVTLVLQSPSGASLSGGPLTVAASGGVASFPPTLAINTAGSGDIIQASSPGLTSVNTGAINVTPAPATHLVVLTEPPAVLGVGTSFGFTVAAEDQFGDVDPNFNGSVTVASPSGSGLPLSGNTTVTASHGTATFAGLVLGATNNPVSLPVTSSGLVSTTTSPISVSAPAVLAFAVSTIAVNEDAGVATIEVVRTGGYQGPVSVQVATAGGTAVPHVNYTPINVTLNFAAGQNSQTFSVPVKNVGVLSATPTVNLVLSSPGAGATLANPSSATLSILNVGQNTQPASTNVKLGSVAIVKVKPKRRSPARPVIVLSFSGGLNAAQAASLAEYQLIVAGKHHSFTAKNAKTLALRSAVYNAANHTVTLTPRKKLPLAKGVELIVNGTGASGLHDSSGNLINGGSNAVAVLHGKTVSITAVSVNSAAVDLLLANGDLAASAKNRKS